jgi:hypothetical protein
MELIYRLQPVKTRVNAKRQKLLSLLRLSVLSELTSVSESALSRRKQGSSPLGSANDFKYLSENAQALSQRLSNG